MTGPVSPPTTLHVMPKQYFIYILTNQPRGVLYTGVTSDLQRRLAEHRQKSVKGFTSAYNASRLVHFEWTDDVRAAIAREKQIKGWLRRRKIALIEEGNPAWRDLADDW